MGKIRLVMLWLMAVILLMGCAASRKVEQGSSEQRRDSVVSVVMDSVAKSETTTDSTSISVKDESHATGTMTDKGSNEETITERVIESMDASGNKTTTTDRTIHRKGDYERNTTYEEQLRHQEETISQMQNTIDSLALNSRLDVGTHWAKKDSTNVQKETNTKDIKATSKWDWLYFFIVPVLMIGVRAWYVIRKQK